LWDLKADALLRRVEGHEGKVTSVAVLADGRRALSGSSDRTLRLWDLETGAELRILVGHRSSVFSVTVLPDGGRAVSGAMDGMRLWDLETGACFATFTGDAAITCVAVARDDLFVAGWANGAVHILELRGPGTSAS
jgi:WD40 repeat protein